MPGHQAEPQYVVAQVEARTNGRGFDVMRRLITEKIDGQLENMQLLSANPRAMRLAANHRERAANADTFKELRDAEKLSGKQYWMAWRGLPVRFEQPALKKIPQHWVRFNRRRSMLTQGNRKAVDPPNALLNYLFGVLEAEIKLTTLAVGLNPHLGMLHADFPFRPSLAADLMEPLRPHVERQVLALLRTRTFGGREFFETREGQCRLVPPLTTEITGTLFAGLPDVRKMVKGVRTGLTQAKGATQPSERRICQKSPHPRTSDTIAEATASMVRIADPNRIRRPPPAMLGGEPTPSQCRIKSGEVRSS